ncbi:16071_t:CDS:10, partial [Gigaspora rosea]
MTFYGIFFFYIIFWTAVVSPTPILKRGYKPKTNTIDLTIEKVTLAPDGFTRQLSTVNGQYPGPTIEVNKGDRILMKIRNKLGEPTAIHAHGMLQRGTPWYDGVPWMEIIVMLNDYHHTNAQPLLKEFLTPESKGIEPGIIRKIDISTKVIEADGSYTKRNKINRLPINVAQRYSVIVTANQPVDNYIMRSEFQKKCMPDAAANLPIIKAIVHYEGAPNDAEPKDNPWSDSLAECVDLDHKTLQPLKEEKIPEATKKFEFEIEFHKNKTGIVKAFLNGSSYIPDINFPTLDKIFKGKSSYERSANAYVFDKDGEVVDLYFINYDEGDHPFHIHGYQFWVLGTGDGDKVNKDELNTNNPIKRDTATIPGSGWMAIRFVSDNPGWHLESGLLMQLVTLPDVVLKMKPPKEWTELCDL